MSERTPLPITNQKLFEMATLITDRLKKAIMQPPEKKDKICWNMLRDDWFDWLEEELFGDEELNKSNEGDG